MNSSMRHKNSMAQRALELTLISARDLKKVNLVSKMKVYAVVLVSGDPRSGQPVATDRTGGRNPTWNATLRFIVPSNAAGSLHVLLRTERALGDRNVGEVHIPLSELLSLAPDKLVTYQVHKIGSGKPKGLLNFSYKLGEVTYPPQSGYPPADGKVWAAPPSPQFGSWYSGQDLPGYVCPPPPQYPPQQQAVHPPKMSGMEWVSGVGTLVGVATHAVTLAGVLSDSGGYVDAGGFGF